MFPTGGPKMDIKYVYLIQILFVGGISFGSQNIDFDNKHKWPAVIARYIVYNLIITGSQEACIIAYKLLNSKQINHLTKLIEDNKNYFGLLLGCSAILYFSNQRMFGEEFLMMFISYLVTKYPQIEKPSNHIGYGAGMACSYFEGYLTHVIPSNGAQFVGFEENIRSYEAAQGVDFPVKRLFIVITKSLYCPPDLKEFNRRNRDDLPWLEACKSLEEVAKDVGGVKNRRYQNSAYKIYREGRLPVHVAAECASPLLTLYRAMQNRALSDVLANINVDEEVEQFSTTLKTIIHGSPECRDKCELVYFDDTIPHNNLADVLLDKIREIEPEFENIILKRRKERREN